MKAPSTICMWIALNRSCASTAMILGNFPTYGNSFGAAWLIPGFLLIHPRQSRADGLRIHPVHIHASSIIWSWLVPGFLLIHPRAVPMDFEFPRFPCMLAPESGRDPCSIPSIPGRTVPMDEDFARITSSS
eukprot:2874301-Amphidinium_carterae.1